MFTMKFYLFTRVGVNVFCLLTSREGHRGWYIYMPSPTKGGGLLANVHIKPFPVRAAIDIGTASSMTLAVARVDAQRRAIQTLMHHQQLPVTLAFAHSSEVHRMDAERRGMNAQRAMSSATITNIRTHMMLLKGVLRRRELAGVSEVCGVVSYPLSECSNAKALAADLSREFAIDVRVWRRNALPASPSTTDDMQLDRVWFNSTAAAAQCIARHRMLCIEEDADGGVSLSGWEHSGTAGSSSSDSLKLDEAEFLDRHDLDGTRQPPLLRHTLPVSVADVHRLLVLTIQRREDAVSGDTSSTRSMLQVSPNPVQRREFERLVQVVEKLLRATMPKWVFEKSESGGVICGASPNGGVLNIAARVASQTQTSLHHLEMVAEHHLCGLTDTLLSEGYPQPQLVLTRAALAAALMRALSTPRIHYLPDVSAAIGLLVAPSLWLSDREAAVRQALEKKRWFKSSVHRAYEPPVSRAFKAQATRGDVSQRPLPCVRIKPGILE